MGVSNYKGRKSDLDGVKKDIKNMQKLFEDWGFDVTILEDAQSMNLESTLQKYDYLGVNDNFIFYYSGHGSHTKDINKDEADGQDETLVLSDGKRNRPFLDDALFAYLNGIKAKKLVIFDSCHSGTAFKTFGDKPKPKSLLESEMDAVIQTKAFRPQQSKISGDYVVFSASQDKELSLDTPNGGLFSRAFLAEFQQNATEKKLVNVRQNIEKSIEAYCQKTDSTPHHPKLSASSNAFKYGTLNAFFSKERSTEAVVSTKSLSVKGKERFNEGELLDFEIDTFDTQGYLTIFSMEEGKPFIMYQSPTAQKGHFRFRDFSIQPPIECYKACKGCASEKSVVYVVLSAKPIGQKEATKAMEIKADGQFKGFRHRGEASFKTLIRKFETTVY